MNGLDGQEKSKYSLDMATPALIWVKLVGVGDIGTGKTCLIKHFCESKFTTGYQPTVGVDYGFKVHRIRGIDLRVNLWDLSGSSDYIDVRNELYGETDGVFIVYDVTNQSSFDNLDNWLKELAKYCNNPSQEVIIVANKVDGTNKRKISLNDGKRWANSHNLRYYETSCLTGDGIEKMFDDLLDAVVLKRNLSDGVAGS